MANNFLKDFIVVKRLMLEEEEPKSLRKKSTACCAEGRRGGEQQMKWFYINCSKLLVFTLRRWMYQYFSVCGCGSNTI